MRKVTAQPAVLLLQPSSVFPGKTPNRKVILQLYLLSQHGDFNGMELHTQGIQNFLFKVKINFIFPSAHQAAFGLYVAALGITSGGLMGSQRAPGIKTESAITKANKRPLYLLQYHSGPTHQHTPQNTTTHQAVHVKHF